jgi:large subunit ribosomal protein L4
MPVVKVVNLSNEEVGELELSDEVFGAPLNKPLIYSAVKIISPASEPAPQPQTTATQADRKETLKQKGTGAL